MQQAATLPAMRQGGAWLLPANGVPTYVAHEAHIKRLVMDGAPIIADPRDPEEYMRRQSQQTQPTVEASLRAEIEGLKAMMQMMALQMQANTQQASAIIDENKKPASKR
jgi:hypothetical protein